MLREPHGRMVILATCVSLLKYCVNKQISKYINKNCVCFRPYTCFVKLHISTGH